MAISIKDLQRVKATLPPRVLIYGPPGMGKTTLASEFPDPVFLQIEDGTPGNLELTSFGRITSYDDLMDAIGALYSEDHGCRTVVIDSLDKLEPLVWERVCKEHNWKDIETPGYGKGYVAADPFWREIMEGMNALRRDKNMGVIYIAHSSIETVNDPMTAAYSRYDIRLHKRAVGIFQDEVDAILFLNQDVSIKADDPKAKSGPGARVRADGGGNRWIYASPRPAFVAKNRYGIPDKIFYDVGKGFESISPHLPGTHTQAQTEKAA